ncbi:MAG TPA: ribosome maturation factor RimM [Gammaproteobacteria bacterium]|nr:ribosome maturation factor RimM [Gammaproteobacteria bacterium]
MVVVGKIGAPYGVRGWVKIFSFTEPLTNLFTYKLLLQAPKELQAIAIEEFRAHGEGFVAKLVDIDDRDQAALLTNLQLVVDREDLPELETEQYYFADLIGLTVFNQDKIELGEVVEFFATGANDVMVVQSAKNKQYLIPFVLDEYIIAIDLPAKRMQVEWDAEF